MLIQVRKLLKDDVDLHQRIFLIGNGKLIL
jgi:hypothetical protein